MNIKKENKGFTLVEIVIVLAIAALILAAILIAVNGAQQSRRDAARRDAGGQIGSLLEESAGNHDGNYPGQAGGISTAAFTTQFQARTENPGGDPVEFQPTYAAAVGACPTGIEAGDVTIQIEGRNWQVAMGLESGDVFCANNN